MTAEQAADGAFAIEGWDEMGFPADQEPLEVEYAAAGSGHSFRQEQDRQPVSTAM
jgi:hypothetical protein